MTEKRYHDAAKAYLNNNTWPDYLKEMAGKGYSVDVSGNLWRTIDIYEYTRRLHPEERE